MDTLTKEAVERVLGPVDEALAAELARTGATEDELHEASAWLSSDEVLVNDFRPPPTGRVGELVEILREIEGPGDEPA